MNVTDVVLSCNNVRKYYQYWNIVSEFYFKVLRIRPHLIFYGTEDDLTKCDLSTEYGTVDRIQPVEHNDEMSPEWISAYLTLYGPATLQDDCVCIVMGIDQVPLRCFWTNLVERVCENTLYTLVTQRPYHYHWSVPKFGRMPGSYLIGKSSTFKKLLGVNKDQSFSEHINDVFEKASRNYHHKYIDNNRPFPFWGLDECYLTMRAQTGIVRVVDLKIDEYIHKNTVLHYTHLSRHFTEASCAYDFNEEYEKVVDNLMKFIIESG